MIDCIFSLVDPTLIVCLKLFSPSHVCLPNRPVEKYVIFKHKKYRKLTVCHRFSKPEKAGHP